MRILLKSDIQITAPGMLTELLLHPQAREEPVSIECFVYRPGFPDPVFHFQDSQPWALIEADDLWSVEANKTGFEALVDRWARAVAQAFADRKIQQ